MKLKTAPEVRDEIRWLGQLISLENVGRYQFASYHPRKKEGMGIKEDVILYIGYYDGKDLSHSYFTLEECMAGTMALVHDGLNSKAGQYFMLSIGILKHK